MMEPYADSVDAEPVFGRPTALSVSDDNGIGDEPALASRSEAMVAAERRRAWCDRQWQSVGRGRQLGEIAGIGLVSGFVAVVCALLRGWVGVESLALVVGAPVVEEVAKVACPLMVLEKRPWAFPSGWVVAALCAVSGLVFATVENILYFCWYIPPERMTDGVMAWRLSVCTLVHVSAATITGIGLARVWRRMATTRFRFEFSSVMPWLAAAMVLHGLYNLGAFVFEWFGKCNAFGCSLSHW